MAAGNDKLIDASGPKLSADEISAKALRFVQSMGAALTDAARKALGAKAQACFKRAATLRPPEQNHIIASSTRDSGKRSERRLD